MSFDNALVTEYVRLRKYDEAIRILEIALQENPDNDEALYLLGTSLHMKGKISHAIEAFKRAIACNPSHLDASISLSVLLNDIGRYEEGSEVFKSANKIITSNNSSGLNSHINKQISSKHEELGDLYFKYFKYEEALNEFSKANNLISNNIELRIKISKVYEKLGQINKAIEILHQIKIEYPDYIQARIQLGLIYFAQSNIIDAQIEWEKALTRDRNNNEILMYINMAKQASVTKM